MPALPKSKHVVNAGIALPPDMIRKLAKTAFDKRQSKSKLAYEIFAEHFKRAARNSARRSSN